MELNDFSKILNRAPELTSAQLIDLAKQARSGDAQARTRLIEGNMRLVITIASRSFHKSKHLGRDDLIQQGFIGLIEAGDRYDPWKIKPKTDKPFRFLISARSDAWIKGTYKSTFNSLVTFGVNEVSSSILFLSSNS